MKILYVLPYVPSPIRVRPYQIIRALTQAGHGVTVAALADDSFASADALAELRTRCDAVHVVPHSRTQGAWQALLALPTPMPLWAAYCHSEALETRLCELVATGAFDVAHIEHLRAAHFVPSLAPLPIVFDAVDCITALRKQMMDSGNGSFSSRLLSWEEWRKLRTYEPRICRLFGQVVVTAEQDKVELQRLDPGSPPITVIANGVDADYFHPDPHIAPEPDTLVFSGKMSYEANQDAASFLLKEILPRLRQSRPRAKAIIVGSSPSRALKSLAVRTGGVTLTGFVDDIRPYLLRATVAVCPIRIGVGIQNKVLEAMAVGRPVVCSPIAARALPETAGTGDGVYVAETAGEFARVCAEILAKPDHELAESGRAARAFVAPNYRWSVAADDLVCLYNAAIAAACEIGTAPASLRRGLATGAV
ncbi:MAG: glycosyltransferase [Fibrella sp.]|nr:glycosyltransferase [Armatimonadota bacterium]